jgi:hypothetical protein
VQTPVQMQSTFVNQRLHELAVDWLIRVRSEWQGFDELNEALLEGCPIPGLVRGHPASVQGIALGLLWNTTCDQYHMHIPCSRILEHTLRTAQVVPNGLLSVGHVVGELGCGEGKDDIYTRAAWGCM